ncbi:MAG: hypothetical protein ABIJ61_02505, partial [bacterium]
MERTPAVSNDGMLIYFSSFRPGDNGSWDIWVSEWDDTLGRFGQAELLDSTVNTYCSEWSVDISPDQKTLWVASGRVPNKPACDPYMIQVSYWDTLTANWGPLDVVDWSTSVTAGSEGVTYSEERGLMIFSCWCELGAEFPCWQGEADLYEAHLEGDAWIVDGNLCIPVNSEFREIGPCLTRDGRTLYFDSRRNTGSYGLEQIFVSYWIDDTVYVEGDEPEVLPEAFDIEQNYPNP